MTYLVFMKNKVGFSRITTGVPVSLTKDNRESWQKEMGRENFLSQAERMKKGSNLLCLVHYPWMRPEHISKLKEDAVLE